MTPIEAMENVAVCIRGVVKEYRTHQRLGTLPGSGAAGSPPFAANPAQRAADRDG